MKEISEIYKIPSIWVTHLLGAVISLFASTDVLDLNPFLREVVSTVANVIPSIASYAAVSSFSQVTLLYFSVASLLGVPAFFSLSRKYRILVPNGDKVIERLGGLSFFYPIGGVLMVGGLFLAAIFAPIGKPWDLMPIHSSRVALAVFGPLFSLLPFLLLAMVVAIFKVWINHRIGGGNGVE